MSIAEEESPTCYHELVSRTRLPPYVTLNSFQGLGFINKNRVKIKTSLFANEGFKQR